MNPYESPAECKDRPRFKGWHYVVLIATAFATGILLPIGVYRDVADQRITAADATFWTLIFEGGLLVGVLLSLYGLQIENEQPQEEST